MGGKSMKKYINGKYVKMTKAEIEELNAKIEDATEQKDPTEERIERLESLLVEVKESIGALKELLHIK